MFDLQAWLNAEVEVHDKYVDKKKMKRSERLCFLIAANGGSPRVTSWGVLSTIPGTTHQDGLEQNQALELMQYDAFMRGLDACGMPVGHVFEPVFVDYLSKHNIPLKDEP